MACEFICDGCGARAAASYSPLGDAHKPGHWFQRSDDDGAQHACSRACIEKTASKSGKTGHGAADMTALTCKRRGCDRPATALPELLLYAAPGTVPAEALLPLPTCDECQAMMTVDDFVGDRQWAQTIAEWPAGRALPRRELTELIWRRYDS